MQGSITPPDSNSSPPRKFDLAFSSPRPDQRLKALPRQIVFALLALIFILAAVLRFHQLTRFSFWIDEGVSVAIARLDTWNFVRILWRREANMSLYYLLLRGWLFFGPGAGEFFVRSLSVIFGVFSVAAIYALGARIRIRSRMTGLVAALLLAVNAYHIRYSQEARGYSLAVFLALLSCYFFFRLLHEPCSKHSRGYVLTSALAVYSHFYVALVLLAQWLSLRVQNSDTLPKKEALRCGRWILIWLAPVAIFILSTGAGPIAWLSRPGVHELYVVGLFFAGGDGNVLALLYLACIACALLIPPQPAGLQPRWNLVFLVLWLVVPIALVFILSFVKPVFLYRYLIVSLPALCLLAACGITRIKPRWLGGILLAAIAALSLIADAGLYARGLDQPLEDWRSATAYILSQSQSGDGIIFYTAQGRMPYEFYAESFTAEKPAIVFPAHDPSRLSYLDFMGKPMPATIASLNRQRVWLVLSHNDPNTEAIQRMLAARYAVGNVKNFPGISVLLYQPTVAGERSKLS